LTYFSSMKFNYCKIFSRIRDMDGRPLRILDGSIIKVEVINLELTKSLQNLIAFCQPYIRYKFLIFKYFD
jgi:hypothetical protein